jgi:branched-chain amino acid transport system ATP-binding protein
MSGEAKYGDPGKNPAEPLLSLRGATARFGGVTAAKSISFDLEKGSLVGLIGPNGAGKSTVLNMISGSVRPAEGDIFLNGRSILGKRPDRLCRLGISRTFQNKRLFPAMTAFENVALGLHGSPAYSLAEAFVRTKRASEANAKPVNEPWSCWSLWDSRAISGTAQALCPYGLQRRLEIARALATSPELLLLDEPAAGMNEDECESLVELIRKVHESFRCGVILIEHHIKVVMDLCADSVVYVMNLGEMLASGSPREIQADSRVIGAYLGEKRTSNERCGNERILEVKDLEVSYGG